MRSGAVLKKSSFLRGEKVMNGIRKDDGSVDGARVGVLVGISIALGIVVHEVFFLIGGVIAVGALAGAVTHAAEEHAKTTRVAHQRR